MRACYAAHAVCMCSGYSWPKTCTLQSAQALAVSGRLRLQPCHSLSAVGPMPGIITLSMPLLVVGNPARGDCAYCTLNEGLGQVLRFGANDASVLERLHWLQQPVAPALHTAPPGVTCTPPGSPSTPAREASVAG